MTLISTRGTPTQVAYRSLEAVAFCAALLLVAGGKVVVADEKVDRDDAAAIAHFEAKIRPLLVTHCYKCHSESTGTTESGLALDSRVGLRAGGDRGPAIVPGKPEKSLLLAAISHTDPDLQMPPKKDRLPQSAIEDVARWIRDGAPDPRTADAAKNIGPVDMAAARRFWSLQKPVRHELPTTKDTTWAESEIDRFVLAKLESAGLTPSPEAPAEVFLRRLYFDLVGLPPSPEAVEFWTARLTAPQRQTRRRDLGAASKRDTTAQRNALPAGARLNKAALEQLVDELLASPQFGERFGRHWLDVARYAESSGKEANISFPYAFRYRDYVVDCFNADIPYNRFLTEQIAGDLLPADSDAERARLLIATGFLALGPKNLDEADEKQFAADVIDEQIDSLTRAVIGSSLACARCHDHKFDPYTMEDYYALAGVFASTKTHFGTFVSPANRIGGDPLRLPHVEGQPIFHKGISPKQVQTLKGELADLKQQEADGRAAVERAITAGEDASEIFTLTDALRIFWRSGAIEGQLEKVDERGNPLPLAMGVLDRPQMIDAPLLERGDITRPGKAAPRGFPQVFQLKGTPSIPADQSGRLELAQWLTHPDHPLTSRVMANRVWHHLLGTGLVRTVDNFGMTGEAPSHPELLDYLAIRFVENDWSIKQLIREIVLSRTYRQASTYDKDSFQADPDNRLLWRMSKRRFDAEAIRDAMLAVSGELNTARPSGSLVASEIGDRPISLIGLDPKIPADLDGSMHRSVYLPVLRDQLADVLDLFDFAEPSLVTGARETTNVPVQALYLMNSPFVQARAKALAARVAREAEGQDQRIRRAFLLCFSRPPDEAELKMATEFLDDTSPDEQEMTSFCQALLCTAEFRNID